LRPYPSRLDNDLGSFRVSDSSREKQLVFPYRLDFKTSLRSKPSSSNLIESVDRITSRISIHSTSTRPIVRSTCFLYLYTPILLSHLVSLVSLTRIGRASSPSIELGFEASRATSYHLEYDNANEDVITSTLPDLYALTIGQPLEIPLVSGLVVVLVVCVP